jgi:hypothetical protein
MGRCQVRRVYNKNITMRLPVVVSTTLSDTNVHQVKIAWLQNALDEGPKTDSWSVLLFWMASSMNGILNEWHPQLCTKRKITSRFGDRWAQECSLRVYKQLTVSPSAVLERSNDTSSESKAQTLVSQRSDLFSWHPRLVQGGKQRAAHKMRCIGLHLELITYSTQFHSQAKPP